MLMFNTHRPVRALVAVAFVLAAAFAALLAPSGARADTWIACNQPTVAGPTINAEGRVYFRGTASCNGPYRLRMIIKVNSQIADTNGPLDASGLAGLGVLSPNRCASSSVYQGVAVVAVKTVNGWQDLTYGTSGAPRRAC